MYRASYMSVSLCLGLVLAFAAAFIPQSAAAATLSVVTATTSSSNASTTLAKVGDTITFGLNLSGTPSATTTPIINIFNMGSTTMSGSGAWWSYSTTSSSAWTEGFLTFRIAFGGSLGEATTTVTQTSLTGANVRFDKTAPSISATTIASNNSSTTLAKVGNVVTLTFTSNEGLSTPSVTIGSQTASVLSGGAAGTSWTASTTISSSDTDGTAITFSVTPVDFAGNASSTAQTFVSSGARVVVDRTGPSITVLGNNPDTTALSASDNSYTDSGATATDSIDSSVTIATTGTVTTNVAGTYTLTYTATDDAGNESTATRTVVVRSSATGGGGGGTSRSPIVTTTATNVPTAPEKNAPLIEQLQAQLAGLLAKIRSLQGSTSAAPGATGSRVNTNTSFERDLYRGMMGDDVRALQMWLNSHGYAVAASGPGSPGAETMMFGDATKAALIKMQQGVKIVPASGYFGPKTRAYVIANQ